MSFKIENRKRIIVRRAIAFAVLGGLLSLGGIKADASQKLNSKGHPVFSLKTIKRKSKEKSKRKFSKKNILFYGGGSERIVYGFLHNEITQRIDKLAYRGVGYSRPYRLSKGEGVWMMDCSNTSRYLYRKIAEMELPRTATLQYDALKKEKKLWRLSSNSRYSNPEYLFKKLRPGDLLFWENTTRPKNGTPITHVMIYLGRDGKGQFWMCGSQSGNFSYRGPRGQKGGPNYYKFRPYRKMGGYISSRGKRYRGVFTAYGRPVSYKKLRLIHILNGEPRVSMNSTGYRFLQ